MAHAEATAVEFIKAVRAGAFDRAAAALPHLNGRYDESLRNAVADLHAHRRLWDEAAEALADVAGDDAKLRRNLYRNLAAMKTHRPAVYRTMLTALEAPAGASHVPHPLPDGTIGVARLNENGVAMPISSNPAAQVRAALQQLKPILDGGRPLAFFGVGDGHVLAAIAADKTEHFLGRQMAVYVIEPDAGLLLACLLAHDFTGGGGPIEQMRVRWFVGENWLDTMRLEFLTDPCLLFPQTNVKQGGAAKIIEPAVQTLLGEIGQRDAAAAAEIARYYAPLTSADYARALAGEAGRPARVLLLTTRFSTVLQYSTRDAEEGFRRIGVEAMTLIEPSPHHGMTRLAMRRALAEFKPDLVFQIDHHRFEHVDVFPAGLPFVNWIQDQLPHLMTKETGRKLSATDFVLAPSLQRWVDDFAYPERQCLEFRKLTRVPVRPLARDSDDGAVVYVSNWSQSATERVEELLAGQTGNAARLMRAACDGMVACYARGESLASPGDVRRLLEATLVAEQLTADEAAIQRTTWQLFDRLNNLLYRQQGLAWAAEACRGLGVRLDVYGNGWEKNVQFAAHARGPIGYGAALETLTRQAAVNLMLDPFMCLTHQRLLDALAAGGFCLLRDHSANHTAAEWIELLSIAGEGAVDSASLRERLSGDELKRFETNFAECERLDAAPGRIDHVATVVRLQQAGFLPAAGEPLPWLDRVAFSSADQFTTRLARYVPDANLRAAISAVQRPAVDKRFGYAGGMGRVLDFVAGRLADTDKLIRPKQAA